MLKTRAFTGQFQFLMRVNLSQKRLKLSEEEKKRFIWKFRSHCD